MLFQSVKSAKPQDEFVLDSGNGRKEKIEKGRQLHSLLTYHRRMEYSCGRTTGGSSPETNDWERINIVMGRALRISERGWGHVWLD
jgi:hypothetical protein